MILREQLPVIVASSNFSDEVVEEKHLMHFHRETYLHFHISPA